MKRFTKFMAVNSPHRRGLIARSTLVLMAMYVLLASKGANAELVINGGFETPPLPPASILTVHPGAEPPGFGWTVSMSNVEVKRQGFVGGGGTLPFNGPPYEGLQSLDLDGYPSPGAISQSFVTTPGTQYLLSFAYANNPYRTGPATATVYVRNSVNSADLITPLPISHGTATASDYHWTLSGPVNFIAQSSSTQLRFVSTNGSGDAGIFLDDISVVPALVGDFNADGKVDAADYVSWRTNTANNPLPNDNGLTNQAARFDLWRANFGNMAGSGSAQSPTSQNSVPEPNGLILLATAAILISVAKRGAR